MRRNLYLEGDLGSQFGTVHNTVATSVQEALKSIEANYPSFRKYLIDAHEEGIEFHVSVAGKEVQDAESLLLPIKEGDITISPVIAGAKSGGGKLLAAAAMFAVLLIPGGAALIPGLQTGAFQSIFAATQVMGGMTALAGTVAMSIATNLALSGLSQIMAPDPSVDSQEEDGYLYQGSTSNIIEGDPIPVLYGELRVPGQPISIAVKSISATENYINNFEESEYLQLELGENGDLD